MCQKAGIFEILSSTHLGSGYRSVHSLKAGVVGASKNNYVTGEDGEEDFEGICD